MASDGQEAINLVEKRASNPNQSMFGLILMDFQMPNMDGPEAVTRILEILRLKNITTKPRIVCVSAYSQKQFKDSALAVGMDAFITKPVFKAQMQEQLIQAGLI